MDHQRRHTTNIPTRRHANAILHDLFSNLRQDDARWWSSSSERTTDRVVGCYSKQSYLLFLIRLIIPWTTGSGRCSRLKSFKATFLTRYQEFLSRCNTTDPLIEQWLKFFCQFIPNIWWANAENFKSISWAISDLLLFNWKILAVTGLQANNCQNFSVKWQ